MTNELRFLCDEMLAGLGRWLRIAGYGTAIAERGRRDRDLVKQAHDERRMLLTRDRHLVQIRQANDRSIVLEANDIDACADEPVRRLSLDWTLDPLSRCTLCNTRLELAGIQLLDTLPPRIRAVGPTVHVCTQCGRLQPCPPHAPAVGAVRRTRVNYVLILDDFARDDLISTLGTPWHGFSDRVMGGISQETIAMTEIDRRRCLRLTGDVRLENNGSFIQMALDLAPEGQTLNAAAYTGVLLVARGNGGATASICERPTAFARGNPIGRASLPRLSGGRSRCRSIGSSRIG